MKVASKITGVVLASLIVGSLFGSLPSGAYAVTFGIGDTVEVYNTGSDGLYVLDAPCGNVIGGKFDGERGVVLDGPVFCADHNRWLIRWNDGFEGWSAENWLRKVQTELALPDLKVTSVNAPVSAEPGGYIAVSWTIENQGNASSDSFHTRISLATTPYGTDISLGNFSMDSIAAGSSLSDAQVPRIPESVPPGYYYVTVYADGFQSISESDENNNIDKAPSQINIPVETVSTPNIPSGPTTGTTSTSYTYSTGGASSNLEHSLEYRFDWGDGSYSGWSSSTSDSHSWSSPSTYIVRAQARCATHTSIISGWSLELTMNIPPPEEETMGTIDVTSDPSGASFTLSGPTNYSGTTPWIMTDAPTGTYTITWGSMSGYTTPLSETKSLTQGETISFYGLYQAIEETVSTPSIPSGPTTGTTDTSYTYSTGGASSSLGHSLEYRFDWGDGSYSGWSSSTSDSHSWSSPSTYIVRAQARCATHTSIISGWSLELTMNIPPPEEETMGTIDVTSDPSGASFTLSGPTNYSGTTPWIMTDAPTGTYTITWGSMSGYTTPLSETKSLTQGETISFYGLYHIPPPAESDHPYDNDFVYTWTIWESGPTEVRLHFFKVELGLNDCLYILDNDRELACYRGNNQGTDLKTIYEDEWTDWFCVDTLKVKFETNSSYTAYGFKIDQIETRPLSNYVLEIRVNGEGTTDPNPGTHRYDKDEEVPITATPDEGWRFDHWESDAQGEDASVTITMDSGKSVTACFESIDDSLKIDDSPQPDNVVLESEHPYDNGCANNWSIWTSGPDKVRLHFHKIELSLNDCVYILDRDRELACYRGIDFKTTWEDHWTDWFTVSPHTLQVELETNNNYAAWGFLIDHLEVKPKAKVNSISPSRVEVGRVGEEVISFSGDGTDPDGSVETCEWRSSIDGQLSTSSSFTTSESDLSEGTHTIYFKVRDNDGNWSEEAIGTVTIEPNRPPIASIDSISPTRITVGEKVSFSGSGTDSEGKVVAYQWRSSIDGPLLTSKSFTTPALSEGTHTIYFKVRDNDGKWSPEVSGTVTVGPPTLPIANIDSISAHRVRVGEEVSFSGSGTDSDGTVVAYEWQSSVEDDLLSTSKSFTTSSLSVGTHTIYFKVRDNDGDWSPEVSNTVIAERDRPYFKIHVNRVHLEVGEDVIVQVTVENLITSPGDMETEITMSIPSGWSIIEWGFFQAVGGLQSAKSTIERGRARSCSVRIQANEPGKGKVTGSIDYWFTDESGGRISEEFHRTESVDVTAAIDLIIETNGQGTTDPNPGKHRCDKDEEVTITATPDPEWRFSHWEGEVPRTSSRSITITMHTSKKITACFSPESPPPRPPLYLIISIIIGSLILVAGFSTLVMRRRRRRST